MKTSVYFKNLTKNVLEKSEAKTWEDAVLEWEIADCEEDTSCTKSCICGKENIRYLFTIKNKVNKNVLFPIGSSCITRFGREELSKEASIYEQMFKLLQYVKEDNFISLSPELFSRKLLRHLYDIGAFNTEYNRFNGEPDYQFMLDMFNKKNKYSITAGQHRKIRAIIVASIKPFLINMLGGKTNQKPKPPKKEQHDKSKTLKVSIVRM